MTKKMLIDAAHPEETRVAIVDGNQLQELDLESATRKQLKGNIYLAKVTRVEPSLQAAFVDYGGNRHGFLAFSEIHPDYYQIPVADREKLVAEENAAAQVEQPDEPEDDNGDGPRGDRKGVETVGGEDIDEVEVRRPPRPVRKYKIQEVIKRRQILLIQVVKEERGNKGAALTTYLSLAGRYCVLMPNTARGGGISRKIASPKDRKRLKSIISEFDIGEGMAVIVRTAGSDRGKAEIKRDYEYLIKLWDNIRNLTLESTAPSLIHEEANLINRAIRDHYTRDIDEVLVEGEEGYKWAKGLMKMLIPSHAKKVQPYRDPVVPLFHRYHVESQLDAMQSQEVQLKSGGYIVLNPTEALVAIDVNSGRATRGRNIEETALKTNVEAAEEIARQLRLRDLAGLIVIDFIDMENSRNQTTVERKLKEAMRNDRARIQIGRISPFGLLELSRQRLRPSIMETMSEPCPHCGGTGVRRSTESTAIHVLRGIEEEGIRRRSREIDVSVPTSVALYVLNHKRKTLAGIEEKYGLKVYVSEDNELVPPEYAIHRLKGLKDGDGDADADAEAEVEAEEVRADHDEEDAEDGRKRRRRRSRRRGRRDDEHVEAAGDHDETAPRDDAEHSSDADADADTDADGDTEQEVHAGQENDDDEERRPRRRRGRRGGRRRSKNGERGLDAEPSEAVAAQDNGDARDGDSGDGEMGATEIANDHQADDHRADGNGERNEDEKPRRRRRRRSRRQDDDTAAPAHQSASGGNGNGQTVSDPDAAAAAGPDAATDGAAAIAAESRPEVTPEPTSEPAAMPDSVQESGPESESDFEPSTETGSESQLSDTEKANDDVVVVEGDGTERPAETGRRGWWNKRLSR